MRLFLLPALLALPFLASACGNGDRERTLADRSVPTLTGEPPLVIAHRGASGLYPEHTLAAYEAAIDMGADFIEPDLVMTRDGVLVARHDRYLSTTTDVAEHAQFAARKTVKPVGDSEREDWFVEDFTLSELKSLRTRQPRAGRPGDHDGTYPIATLTEILGLVAITNQAGQTVGIYPELKSPSYYKVQGMDPKGALVEALEAADLTTIGAPVFIQSFEPWVLRELDEETDWPLVQLLPATTGEALTPNSIAEYADGIGPWKQVLIGFEGGAEAYIALAHGSGLVVHPYTFRDDDVGPGFATIEEELRAYFDLGVDGVFTDFPDTALRVRAAGE